MGLIDDFVAGAVSDCVNGSTVGLAAGIRSEAQDVAEGRGPWNGKLAGRPCRSCERESLDLEDGECGQCRGVTSLPDPRSAEYKRALYLRTARLLRDLGYPDRAVWYEEHA